MANLKMESNVERRQVLRNLERGLKRVQAGWCQGEFKQRTKDGVQYCAWGGVRGARDYGHVPAIDVTIRTLTRGIKKVTPRAVIAEYDNLYSIFNWNDQHGRKKSEVVRAFKHAIKIAEKAEVA